MARQAVGAAENLEKCAGRREQNLARLDHGGAIKSVQSESIAVSGPGAVGADNAGVGDGVGVGTHPVRARDFEAVVEDVAVAAFDQTGPTGRPAARAAG